MENIMTDKEYNDLNQMISDFTYGVDVGTPEYESAFLVMNKYNNNQDLYDDLVDYYNEHSNMDGTIILFFEHTFDLKKKKHNAKNNHFVNVYSVNIEKG